MTTLAQSKAVAQAPGSVIAVHGSVIDVQFLAAKLPELEEAILIEADAARELIADVQQHLDSTAVRSVALENTAGLRRGAKMRAHRQAGSSAGGGGGAWTAPQRDRRAGRLRPSAPG